MIASQAILDFMATESPTLCTCWRIELTCGQVKGFTDFVDDLVIDGLTYFALAGYKRTAVSVSQGLSTDNISVEGILNSTYITEDDLLSGLYDYAKVQIFLVNYKNLSMGGYPLLTGHFGEIVIKRGTYSTDIDGLAALMDKRVGISFAPECPLILGDAKCSHNISLNIHCTGTVINVVNNRYFYVQLDATTVNTATGSFDYGQVAWTSGFNASNGGEIKTHVALAQSDGTHQFTLYLPMSRSIRVGDRFNATVGCAHDVAACKKFNNIKNYGGFPHIPGIDKLLQRGKSTG